MKDKLIAIKTAYALENLHFYPPTLGKRANYVCTYISDKNQFDDIDSISILDLQFMLQALSIGQGHVYFKDVNKICNGMDELKREYLIFKLAGI